MQFKKLFNVFAATIYYITFTKEYMLIDYEVWYIDYNSKSYKFSLNLFRCHEY
jgi:hypothetical protein